MKRDHLNQGTFEEIAPLPLRKVIRIAAQGIRIRMGRSLLVVSGIVLAVAFLSYIVASDLMMRNSRILGSPDLIAHLAQTGGGVPEQGNQRIQTYWTVGLAMMICFVGIMNAMLMSVTERFREIGTMKCLGALDGFVLRLFLVESIIEGAVGTVAGLGIGLAAAWGDGFTKYGVEALGFLPGDTLAALAFGSFITGSVLTVLGALYPAYQAARMAPVMALRSEV
jgi:putative ABC transport system permease protein